MKYTAATKLENNDTVTVKRTNRSLLVDTIFIHKPNKHVQVMLSDGNWYNHKEIK